MNNLKSEEKSKIGFLTKKKVFRWTIDSKYVLNLKESVRSDFFTISPIRNKKFCLSLEYESEVVCRNLFYVCLQKSALRTDLIHNDDLPIKVNFSFLDSRNRSHHTCEKVLDTEDDKALAQFDLFLIKNQQMMLLKNNLFTISCSLDVDEIINENSTFPDSKSTKIVETKQTSNHHDLVADMTKLLDSQKLSDLTITADEKDFNVHRAILAARSPVFAAMFEHDTIEKMSNRVNISDITSDVLQLILKYIYTNEVGDMDPNTCLSLLIAADKYSLPQLKRMCSSFLCANLTAEAVVSVLTVASFHEDSDLKDAAICFILNNALEVMKGEEWLSLLKDHPSLANTIILQLASRK
ncbi:speckle-type POZ protein-like [Uloborus diversus]|uniref:speckle-type POZ protein-like n=1 Tax=Uloborus diversus TaxID=327109 RepID=UPI00240A9761|nr:speckle-type POZ protein-like [Uloborus diversus]